MTEETLELQNINIPTPTETRKRGRAKQEQAKWRYNSDGTYNDGPIDPEYGKKYYHLKLATPINCELCGRTVSTIKMKRHQSTNVCKETHQQKLAQQNI